MSLFPGHSKNVQEVVSSEEYNKIGSKDKDSFRTKLSEIKSMTK